MEDILLLDATERYLRGEMGEDERRAFEELRKNNPEVDQFVVEHHFFLEEMGRYGATKQVKGAIHEIHNRLEETGEIKPLKSGGSGKVVQMWNRYKRTIAVAASIAGLTALLISGLVTNFSSKSIEQRQQVESLRREVNTLKTATNNQSRVLNEVKGKIEQTATTAPAPKFEGTCFLIDARGYLVTNQHVVKSADAIRVQNTRGQDFKARVVYTDSDMDIAVLKIEDDNFKTFGALPYSIKKSSTDLAEPIFTLGFPREEIVYSEGYLSAKTGYNGDTLSCQISIPANPGNSGGPVLNRNGEVIGILSTRQIAAEGVVFAINARNIFKALDEVKKDSTVKNIRVPMTSNLKGLDRVQQVKKIQDCIFMVKGY